MLFKKLLHITAILLVIVIAGVIMNNREIGGSAQYQKLADKDSQYVIPSDWKTYSNPEIGVTFRYPADFIIESERHIPESTSNAPYTIDLTLSSPRGTIFRMGTFTTGFEGDYKEADIRPKVITTLSGQTITRTVYVESGEYHIIALGEQTPFVLVLSLPKDQVDVMVGMYDVILGSIDLNY